MTIRELDLRPAVCVSPLSTTDDAIYLMWRHDVRNLLVTDREGLVGVVTDGDLLESVGMLMQAERECVAAGTCEEILVADVMDAEAACVSPDTPLADAAHHLIYGRCTALPVVDGVQPVGIVTESNLLDLLDHCADPGRAALCEEPVMNHSSRVLRTVSRHDCLRKVCEKLNGSRCRYIPVIEDGRLAGIVSDWDVRMAIGRTQAGEWFDVPVTQAMFTSPRTLRPDDTLERAARVMRDEDVAALPVTTRDGLLLSMITATDVLRVFVSDAVIHL